MTSSRRQFLAQAGAALAGAALGPQPAPPPGPEGPLIDFHVHLFGVGDGGTGCFLSPEQRRHPSYRYLRWLLGISENGRMDQDYLDLLVAQLRASSLKRAVLLAQDCRCDGSGAPDPARSSFYVPNDYLFQVVERFPDLFIPCVSVNPRRRDALDELERCAARGARLLKVHPPTQDVDPSDPALRPFWRRCAERRVTVMFHTGGEQAAPTVGDHYSDPSRLAPALEEGCTVIAAHSGMGNFFDGVDYFPQLLEMLRRFPGLYCECSMLASLLKWRSIPRILREPEALGRLIHGSDFPFPPNALVFWNRLPPGTLFSLLSERNLIERDYRLKRALGIPADVFERGAKLIERR